MKYAYYPGCSAESTAQDQHISILEVAKNLGIELQEPKGWSCCGSTSAHHTNKLLSVALPVANLLKVQEMDMDMVVSCAACYNRMKVANHEVNTNHKIKEQVDKTIGKNYDGNVKVRHFIEILLEDFGIENLKKHFVYSLSDLKVACYYGCLLVRPPEVMKFDNPENPSSMEKLIEAMGGEGIEWPHKVECCGGGFTLSRPEIVVELSGNILEMAEASGAQCIAVACPMCQANLDMRQNEINKKKNTNYSIPIIYITQLLGLCLGIPPHKLGLKKSIVSPEKVVNSISKILV